MFYWALVQCERGITETWNPAKVTENTCSDVRARGLKTEPVLGIMGTWYLRTSSLRDDNGKY